MNTLALCNPDCSQITKMPFSKALIQFWSYYNSITCSYMNTLPLCNPDCSQITKMPFSKALRRFCSNYIIM